MKRFSKMTVDQISLYLKDAVINESQEQRLQIDSRAGVRKLLAAYFHKQAAAQHEADRIHALQKYERQARANGYTYIAGIDEAGRGPLAGPVMAAAVILPATFALPGLKDSKKVSVQKRDELYAAIKAQAVAWCVGVSDVDEIDVFNILQATKIAMKRALYGLAIMPDYVLIDALELDALAFPQQGIINGDSLSASIAAASIMAKVTRDRLMQELESQYPGYGFAKHKGYPTVDHRKAIAQLGACPLHRKSFLLLPAEDTA